jgi:hypothetical protein
VSRSRPLAGGRRRKALKNVLTVANGPEPRNMRALDVASSVIPFPNATGDPYSVLTARMVVERFRRGELPEAILLALMASAGLQP